MSSTLLLATIAFLPLAATPPVSIGGFTFHHVDPGPPFIPAHQPQESHQPASPTGAERRAGLIAYWRPAPELLRPWSRPRPDECIRRPLKVFAARGETEPVWIALYALDDLSSISTRLENLPPGLTADLFVVHFWPQRTSWKSRQYYVTPELLLPYDPEAGEAWFPTQSVLQKRPYSLKAGQTGALWLRITADRSAAPGDYTLRLRIRAHKRSALAVPLRLTILPFELRKPPDHRWLLYGDVHRWQHMSDQQRWLDAKDFAAHGIDGIVSMPLGTPDLSNLAAGQAKWDLSVPRRYLELLSQAGLRGPWVMSGRLAPAVRDALGIKADLYKSPWPDPIRNGLRLAAGLLNKAYQSMGIEWYFYGWDEPSADNIYAVEQYKNWHLGGAPIYVTICRPGFWEAMAQYLDAPCFSTGMIGSQPACQKTRDACRRLGKQFWWYGSGCYIGQEGRMFPNRYLAGCLFWLTQARCQVSWTFCRPHEDPFNDFDGIKANRVEPKEQCTVYPWLDKPSDWATYRGPIQTIQWEALREGIDDYCYLWTLRDQAARAASAPSRARARAGRHAKRALRDIEALLPWPPEARRLSFSNSELTTIRWLVAQQIVTLSEEKLSAPGSRVPTRRVKVNVQVKPATLAPARSLPITAIPIAAHAPSINGHLDDAAWQSAARVPINRDTHTGQTISPAATALLTYDQRALYVAIKCPEPMMKSLKATHTGRDPKDIWLDDSVEVFLDPTGQRKAYAHFIVNPLGAFYDELSQDPSWDSSARVAAARFQDAWAVEIEIPWADLARAGLPRRNALALNVCRNRHADPASGWTNAAWSVTYGWFHIPARFGIALLETRPVGLTHISIPHLIGPGHINLTLRNSADQHFTPIVSATLIDAQGHTVSQPTQARPRLSPRSSATVALPIHIAAPGSYTLRIQVSTPSAPPLSYSLPLNVAEPATLLTHLLTIDNTNQLTIPLELNVQPGASEYTLTLRVRAADHQYWRATMKCSPRQPCSMQATALLPSQTSWLTVSLTSPTGSRLWQTRVPLLPVFDPLS